MDNRQFRAIVDAYADMVYRIALNQTRRGTDADDVVQDTLLRYYSLSKDYASEAHLKAWLIRVAVNRAKDITSSFWRKHQVEWEDYMNELAFEEPEDGRLFEAVMRRSTGQ